MNKKKQRYKNLRKKGIPASRGAEMVYVKALKGVMRPLHDAVKNSVESQYQEPDRQDAKKRGPWDVKQQFSGASQTTGQRVERHFNRMADAVNKQNKESFARIVPIQTKDFGVDKAIDEAREANISLITEASEDYLEQISDVVAEAYEDGWRVERLMDEIIKRGGVSESRAELIARDQTLKLNAGVTRIRMQNAGIERYEWSTSLDDRVRPEHEDLEGLEFSWDDPPEPGNPGEDYQCRCVAVPILPDDSDDEESEDDEEPEE